VGWVIPLLAIATTLAIGARGAVPLGKRYIPWLAVAFVAAFGLALIWAIPANNATHGEFYRLGIGLHVIERSETPLQHHGGNFLLYEFYYPAVILFYFLPWTIFLPGMISALCGGRLGGRMGRAFLIGATVPTLVMMTIVQTKLPHYILPIWPALALAVAATVDAAERNALSARDLRWLRRGVWFFAPAGILVALGLSIAPLILSVPGLTMPCFVASGVIFLATWIVVRQHLYGSLRSAIAALVIGAVVIEGTLTLGLLPVVERAKAIPPLAKQLRPLLRKDTRVMAYDVSRATLKFYVGRRIDDLRREAAVAWARYPDDAVLIIDERDLRKIEEQNKGIELVPIARSSGYDYSHAKWVELEAVVPKDSALARFAAQR